MGERASRITAGGDPSVVQRALARDREVRIDFS